MEDRHWSFLIFFFPFNYILLVFIKHTCYGASEARSLIAEVSDKIVSLFYCLGTCVFLSTAEDSLSSDNVNFSNQHTFSVSLQSEIKYFD